MAVANALKQVRNCGTFVSQTTLSRHNVSIQIEEKQQWQNIRTKKQQSITKTPPSLIVRRRNSTERVTTKTAGSTPVKLTATRTGLAMLRKKRTTNRKVRDKSEIIKVLRFRLFPGPPFFVQASELPDARIGNDSSKKSCIRPATETYGAAYPVRCMAARSPVAYRFIAHGARRAPNAQPGNLSRKCLTSEAKFMNPADKAGNLL
jgi:hypothetical protein